ncbi:cupin domain-containing protein [Planomicrobium okeanokoites]|uniref:cupin domain-containing protein n=1 Tax=Planomicrobium okeanokoites TaxID=244 RepID=UPI003564EA42
MVTREILSSEGSVMVVKVRLAEGFAGDVDQHPEEQVTYIVEGQLEFDVEGDKRILNPGDTQYIPSNSKHQVKVLKECVLLDVFTPIRKDLLAKS